MTTKNYSILLIAILFWGIPAAKAQDSRPFQPNFNKGDIDLGFGIGFGSHLSSPEAVSTMPMIAAHGDYALRDDLGAGVIGIGGLIGYEQYKREYSGGLYGYNNSSLIMQFRGTYHYQFLDNFDTYGGLSFGFRVTGSKEMGTFPSSNSPEAEAGMRPSASVFVGGRYFFAENAAAFAEVGAGVSYLTLGITIKL